MSFCVYIGRKWFGLRVEIWIVWWTKVLILVGFDDIGCDIGIFGVDGGKVGIFMGFCGILFECLKIKFV